MQKLVLLAIADCANDEGVAWPSIQTIARKSGASARTVQRHIREIEEAGLLEREEVLGKGCFYRFKGCQSVTGARLSRVTETTRTPVTVTPKPSRTVISSSNEEDSAASPLKRWASRPEDVSDEVWQAFRKHRKSAFTDLALKGFRREAADAGWTVEAAMVEALERGWQGFKASWVKEKTTRGTNNTSTRDIGERIAQELAASGPAHILPRLSASGGYGRP
jgi:DNA-binding transcriptional ArsR family regulator